MEHSNYGLTLKAKSPNSGGVGAFSITSLTITYFHTGCSTIIGAESFHGPVRDGKGWYQLAMVIRHNLSVACIAAVAGAYRQPNPEEAVRGTTDILAGVMLNRAHTLSCL